MFPIIYFIPFVITNWFQYKLFPIHLTHTMRNYTHSSWTLSITLRSSHDFTQRWWDCNHSNSAITSDRLLFPHTQMMKYSFIYHSRHIPDQYHNYLTLLSYIFITSLHQLFPIIHLPHPDDLLSNHDHHNWTRLSFGYNFPSCWLCSIFFVPNNMFTTCVIMILFPIVLLIPMHGDMS